jgi:hypothetical protein
MDQDQLRLMLSKGDVIDRHIHLHTQDLFYRPRLSTRPGFRKGVFSGVLSGLILVAWGFGAVWFELWKWPFSSYGATTSSLSEFSLRIGSKRTRNSWEFDLVKVKIWLEAEEIKIKRIRPTHLSIRPLFDHPWFGERCPMGIDRGFPWGKAGRLYTLREVSEEGWNLRRTGIQCGHSSYLNIKSNSNSPSPRMRSGISVKNTEMA